MTPDTMLSYHPGPLAQPQAAAPLTAASLGRGRVLHGPFAKGWRGGGGVKSCRPRVWWYTPDSSTWG